MKMKESNLKVNFVKKMKDKQLVMTSPASIGSMSEVQFPNICSPFLIHICYKNPIWGINDVTQNEQRDSMNQNIHLFLYHT